MHEVNRTRSRLPTIALAAVALVACAGGPGPGDTGRGGDASGSYSGRLVVQGERFDAKLDLRGHGSSRVSGTFVVSAPIHVDGQVEGTLVDNVLRMTITYDSTSESGCVGRIEGILDVKEGGDAIDGPVTVSDCQSELPGRMTFSR
jgi:hypothetical protein